MSAIIARRLEFQFIKALKQVIVEVGIIEERGCRRFIPQPRSFGQAAVPLFRGQMSLPYARQGVELAARVGRKRGNSFTQSSRLRCFRR